MWQLFLYPHIREFKTVGSDFLGIIFNQVWGSNSIPKLLLSSTRNHPGAEECVRVLRGVGDRNLRSTWHPSGLFWHLQQYGRDWPVSDVSRWEGRSLYIWTVILGPICSLGHLPLVAKSVSSEPFWLWSQMVHKFPQRLHIPLLELVGTSSHRASGNPFPHTPLWQMPRVWKYLLCTAGNQESTPPSSERSPRFILLILMLLLVYPSGSMHLRHIGLSSSHHLCCSLQDQRGFL